MTAAFKDERGAKKGFMLWALLSVFLGATVLYSFSYFFKPEIKETIKIGVILSLTGPGSHLVDMRDAMEMAADEVNSQGGVNGRSLELLVQDNKTEADEAKKVFAGLEEKQKPLLYVSALSTIGMALKPLAEKNQVILVGLNTSAPEFTENSIWIFRDFFTAAGEARAAMNRLSDLRIKKLGIIYLDDPYGDALAEALEKKFSSNERGVRKISFQMQTTDFSPQIKELENEKAIYLAGFAKHINTMISQLRKANYQGIILSPGGGANPLVTEMEEAEGVYLAAPKIYNQAYPFAKKFKDDFQKRYGKTMSHQAANGYDFIKIIAGLLEGTEVSRTNIRQLFDQGFMYSGVMGEQELEAGSRDIEIPLYPAIILDKNIMFH